jgi:hypothetical protein
LLFVFGRPGVERDLAFGSILDELDELATEQSTNPISGRVWDSVNCQKSHHNSKSFVILVSIRTTCLSTGIFGAANGIFTTKPDKWF